jgi:conserved oligomeric Golgi complex subunit 3
MVLDVPAFPSPSSRRLILPAENGASSSLSDDNEAKDNDELTFDFDKPRKKGLGRLHIGHLLQMVLRDAQTRLFFKAQSVIQSDIQHYVPKAEDLAYPDKLVGEYE